MGESIPVIAPLAEPVAVPVTDSHLVQVIVGLHAVEQFQNLYLPGSFVQIFLVSGQEIH